MEGTPMSTVKVTVQDSVMLMTMARPEALNAFSGQLMDDLTDAFLTATSDDVIKVVVLTGAGRAFSAGADLMEMGRQSDPPRHGFPGLLDAIIDFPKPLLLAVNGLGVGIGATICGLADMTWMAESARLRCPFSSLGLTAEAASTFTLPLLLGRQRASWFLLASEWMSAAECHEAGLVLGVLPDDP
jgi:enoyl-CoA hydratase/carnithine racemase